MSVQKKKKLETAINNLFSTPRAKPAPAEVVELIQEFIQEAAIEEKMIVVQTVVQPDPNLAEKAVEQAEQPGQRNTEQVIPNAANLPEKSGSQPDFSLPVDV